MDITRRQFITAASALTVAQRPGRAAKGQLKVITSTEDMAALAREVGGDRISVESLGKGYQDSHFVEPKPSFISKVHGADLLISVGLQLEIGWLPPLITQSRNPRVQPGAPGYLEASQFAEILENLGELRGLQIPWRSGLHARITALRDQGRQPSYLQLQADRNQQIGAVHFGDEAGLGLDEMRILVALAKRLDRDAVSTDFARQGCHVFGGSDDFELTLRGAPRPLGDSKRRGRRYELPSCDVHRISFTIESISHPVG